MKKTAPLFPILLLITVILYRCTPEPQDPNLPPTLPIDTTATGGGVIPPQTPSDSVVVLNATGGVYFSYGKDSLPEKMSYFNYPTSYLDTTFLYYTADKKIDRVMTITKELYPYKTVKFATYSGSKISKIYEKRPAGFFSPEYDDPNYMQNLGIINPAKISSYDSLVYDGSQRLIGKYHFTSNNTVFKLISYILLDYHNPNNLPNSGGDSLLYRVQLFDDQTNSGTFTMKNKVYFHAYDFAHGKANPLYKTFKEYALFTYGIITFHNVQPIQQNSDGLDAYISMNPYPITTIEIKDGSSWSSYPITLSYDTQGRLINAGNNSVFAGGLVGYSYVKIKK